MLEIRRITEADLDAIVAMQSASHEAATWNVRDYLEFETWLAELDGEPVGFLVMRTLVPGEHELLNMAVDPGRRRRGIGRELLKSAMERAPGIWFLEVRESNAAAQELYKALGFNRSGKRKGYYQKPYEDGIVMRKHS